MIARSFYFLRHGETEWNVEKRLQGHTDIPLNENGRAQAQKAAAILQKHKIDRVVVSPLLRASHTAEIINQTLKKPLIAEPKIMEKHFGELEGRTFEDIEEWKKDNAHRLGAIEPETGYAAPPGGEAYPVLLTRVLDGFSTWLNNHPEEDILFVSHGGVYRALCRHFFDTADQSPNAQPFQFIKEDGNLWTLRVLT